MQMKNLKIRDGTQVAVVLAVSHETNMKIYSKF